MSLLQQKMCEGCGEKRAAYGLPDEGRKSGMKKQQWCARCAVPGAVISEPESEIRNQAGRSKKRRKKRQRVEASVGKRMLQGQLLQQQAKLGVIKEALAEQEKKISKTIAMIEDDRVRPSVSSFSLIYC